MTGTRRLFEVLYLLAALFQFILEIDHHARKLHIGDLVAAGVDLAEAFLQREVQTAAGILARIQQFVQAGKVGVQTGQLFGDVQTVGQDGSGSRPGR